jgi:hypothetical protein
MSRTPESDMCSVRGIGVAESVSMSTLAAALEVLLVRHAEALLLVDDHQAEVLELDVLRQEPVGADDDVDLALARRTQRVRVRAGDVRESTPTVTGKSAMRSRNVR